MNIPRIIRLAAVALFLGVPLVCRPQSGATNLWSLTPNKGFSGSSPAIADDGTIYIGNFHGELQAITPAGKISWTFDIGREIKSSPAIADDGTIYFGSRDWKLYALAPDGKFKWSFPTGAWVDSSPAIGADGTIYFGSWDTNFYALNSGGSLKWKFATGGIVDSSPAIGADGTIYFGSHDKKFYALKPDGTLRWSFATGGTIISSPAINSDGTVYFTSTDGNLYALKPDGSERWHLHTGGVTASSPVLDGDGVIYVAANRANIAVNSDGKQLWGYDTGDWIDATLAVAANRVVYCPQPQRDFCALGPGGALQWRLPVDWIVFSSPAIAPDGRIYAATDRTLYAITCTNAAPLAKSPWPMFHANLHHTGRANVN